MKKMEKLLAKKKKLDIALDDLEDKQNELDNKAGELEEKYDEISDELDDIDEEIGKLEREALNEPVAAAVKIVKKSMPKLSKELDESVVTLLNWALHRFDMKV